MTDLKKEFASVKALAKIMGLENSVDIALYPGLYISC
jgi:hypothetical protein